MTKTFLLLLLSLFAFSTFSFAQQTSETPAWEVTLQGGSTARSSLTVVNRCKKSHTFEIVLENISFMKFPSSNQVTVSGGKSVDLPVLFDTGGLSPGLHTGTVVVVCKTCGSEKTCMQDRERLPVKLTVSGPATAVPTTTSTPPSTTKPPPINVGTAPARIPANASSGGAKGPCEEAENNCEHLRLKAWEMESQAASARSLAQQARLRANERNGAAVAAEQKARDLTAASKDSEGELARLTDPERRRVYTGRDFKALHAAEDKIWADFRAAKISSPEAYLKLQELSGPDGLSKSQDAERKRLSELKYQAAQATTEAEQARAAANAAETQAKAVAEAAKRAGEEAAKARAAYEECVRRIPSDCPRPGGLPSGAGAAMGGPQSPSSGAGAPGQAGGGGGGGIFLAGTGKGPCEDDCKDLLQAVQFKEAEAAKAQAMADEERKRAEGPEQAAREAEEASRKAAEAAKDPTSRGRVIDDLRGRVYTERDFELVRQANRDAWSDYKSGKINSQQLEQRWKENSGFEALDRLQAEDQRQLAERKFEAEQLAKKAAAARAAANASSGMARAAQQAADGARAEAERARKAYEDCLKKMKEECEKQRIAREKADAVALAAAAGARKAVEDAASDAVAAAAVKQKQEAERRKKEKDDNDQKEAARIAKEKDAAYDRARYEYLVHNIKELNLIPYKGWTNVPGFWDWLPKYLETPIGNLVEDRAGGPIPLDVIKAMGGLYNILNILLDPCTWGGSQETRHNLLQMKNTRTDLMYTEEEAIRKTLGMCEMMTKLKERVEAQARAQRGPK